MPYEIIISEKIQRIIDKKCDKHIKKHLFTKLLKLEKNPHSCAKPLRSPLAGIWEFYFKKSWRVLFEIDENSKSVIIVGFKHKDEMKQL